jgi:hypothetical protein
MRREVRGWGAAARGGGALGLVLCVSLGLGAPAGAAERKVAFESRGSVEQVHVTGAKPGSKLTLVDRRGDAVETQTAGSLGGVIFRKVEPGGGYRVRRGAGEKGAQSGKVRVLTTRSRPPRESLYDQTLPSRGYGYLRTRDGTHLAINVWLPGPQPNDGGPYPTLIEYSGYGYADPDGGESSIQAIAGALGFAVVDVNMRGTGCSGGAFDFFEPLQALDGYDVIETVARQPWVLHNKVGMMGISYGGISQLFVGATRPPSLSAIAPISVLDQTQTTLYPGGILNTGFALEWAKDRIEDAEPASPDGGQGWAYERIQEGDEICRKNQELHTEAVNLLGKIRRNQYYRAKVADPLSPITFVDKINVPTFMACQWTDEQTGGHCPTLASRFRRTDRKWFTFTNGTHIDSLAPSTFNRWYDFLQLYVAQRKPQPDAIQQGAAPVIYQAAMGVPGVTLPEDPIQQQPDYASALAAFEALPPVRILFDNGAGRLPGQPYEAFERTFSSFPPKGTKGRKFFLGGNSALAARKPAKGGADRFTLDRNARPPTNFTGNTGAGTGGLWTATPPYEWTQSPTGTAVSYVSEPLDADATVLGAGALRAWIRSSVPDADLQVTVSEVRPDGKETFVQSGWLRGSLRKLDREKSTKLEPVLSLREADAKPLPSKRWAKVTVPLYYQGHVYRAGSSIRVTVSAVGGDQPVWAFANALPAGTAKISVARSREMPSALILPVTEGSAPTALPPCPSLRGQPCRDYVPFVNRKASLR